MVFACFGNILLFGFILAIWVFRDSRKRDANWLQWSLGALVMGPIFVSLYHAQRPLLDGEVREGGPDWIVARNFAWLWIPYMGIIIFWTAITLFFSDTLNTSENTSAIQVRNVLTLGFMGMCWLIPVALGFLLSVLLVVPDDIEGADGNENIETSHDKDES